LKQILPCFFFEQEQFLATSEVLNIILHLVHTRNNNATTQEPYKPAAHLRLLEKLAQHPREYAGYLDLPGPLPLIKPGTQLRIRDEAFAVGDMLGEGGFAKVPVPFTLPARYITLQYLCLFY